MIKSYLIVIRTYNKLTQFVFAFRGHFVFFLFSLYRQYLSLVGTAFFMYYRSKCLQRSQPLETKQTLETVSHDIRMTTSNTVFLKRYNNLIWSYFLLCRHNRSCFELNVTILLLLLLFVLNRSDYCRTDIYICLLEKNINYYNAASG